MLCPRCGTKLGSGVTFCFNCNADLRQPSALKPRSAAHDPAAPAVVDEVVYASPVARLCAAILDGIVIGVVYGLITVVVTAPSAARWGVTPPAPWRSSLRSPFTGCTSPASRPRAARPP